MKHRRSIDLSAGGSVQLTLGRMRDDGYSLHAFCARCDRHRPLDLALLCKRLGENYAQSLCGRIVCSGCKSRDVALSLGGPQGSTNPQPAR